MFGFVMNRRGGSPSPGAKNQQRSYLPQQVPFVVQFQALEVQEYEGIF